MIPAERAHLFVAAQSHKGMKKGKNNEDRYAISSYSLDDEKKTPALFAIVSDGVGGHLAGEVAAEMVVNYVSDAIAGSDAQDPLEIMEQAVCDASLAVHQLAAEDEEKFGMGATCVCAWVIDRRLYAASVGDSRLYLMRGAVIQQLSTDHTWIQDALDKGVLTPEQARNHPNAHVIRQYVGGKNLPSVDFRLRYFSSAPKGEEKADAKKSNQGLRLKAGDTLLLCSDGLTDLVWDDEILEIVRTEKDLESAAQKLIDTANERGGHDNITVVLLSVPPEGKTPGLKNPVPWIIGGVVALLLFLSILVGFIWYLMQAPKTPVPTATATGVPSAIPTETIETTSYAPPPVSASMTASPSPTIGATYTPWPTNTPPPLE